MFESLEAFGHQIVEFVKLHEVWAAPIVFALAFGESLAFISLLIPAWAALVGIGVLISSGGINFWPVWVAGALGAAIGDWLSYWIGVKLGPPVAHIWPLSRHPTLIPKGEAFVNALGRARNFHRALLRAAARVGAAGRRHLRHALLALPGRELHLGVRLGGRAAHARRRRGQGGRVGLGQLTADAAVTAPACAAPSR